MKSTTTNKKPHSAPKSNHKPPLKVQKTEKGEKGEAKAERGDKAPLKAEPEVGKPGRAARTRKGAAANAAVLDDQPKTRLALIKARHEAIKREIDQIREDLESDEDE